MAREINLVPDIKNEMIKTLKLRNFIFFLCIVVAIASAGVTLVAGLIMGGQQLALTSKQNTLDKLSNKLNSYSDLNDFLTIKDQLGNLSDLNSNKKVLSRTFNILSALLPTGADTITVSELSVNLSEEAPTFTFDAQANAGKEPFIDYNVLDSFKKSMQYMRYDYGNYVDKKDNIIPAYCMIETGKDGAVLHQSSNVYAFWTIEEEGCKPENIGGEKTDKYNVEKYEGKNVVRIWRTPQFSKWYKQNPKEGEAQIGLDGKISNVEHFQSSCITYTGDDSKNSSKPEWTTTNEECKLIPAGVDGINITDSSNGRGSSDELVLRFSAIITLAPEAYQFANHHFIAVAPSGRHNVTDSYVQVQAMFGERAADCAEGDTACNSNTSADTNTKANGGNN